MLKYNEVLAIVRTWAQAGKSTKLAQ